MIPTLEQLIEAQPRPAPETTKWVGQSFTEPGTYIDRDGQRHLFAVKYREHGWRYNWRNRPTFAQRSEVKEINVVDLADDWVGLYVNGRLHYQGHSIPRHIWLEVVDGQEEELDEQLAELNGYQLPTLYLDIVREEPKREPLLRRR